MQRPQSIVEAKAALSAWGDAGDAQVAGIRSQVSGLGRLAAVGGGAAIVAVIFKGLLRVRNASVSKSKRPQGGLSEAEWNARKAGHGDERRASTWLNWALLARVGRWALPFALNAARTHLASRPNPAPRPQPASAEVFR